MPYQCFCKNLSGLFLYTVGRRYTFRRYSGAPLEAKKVHIAGREVAALFTGGEGAVFTGGSVSVRWADFGTLLYPEFPLRDLPRSNSAQPFCAGRSPRRCEELRFFDQALTLGAPAPVGLAFRRATEGSRWRP